MGDSLEELDATATLVAKEAGKLLARHFREVRVIEFKGGIDLVTDADKASEALVLRMLRERHPEHGILSEEAGLAQEGTHPFRWVVDPLDGTTNYSHQVPHFCVSIGVEREGQVVAGAVYDPIREELFSARKGGGAWLNGLPIRASATTALKRALLCTGFPYNVEQHPEGPVGLLVRFAKKAQGIRRMGSAALELSYVAAGRLDGYFEFGLKPWDVAAGGLLVEEAGGSMSGMDGGPWEAAGGNVLASAAGIAGVLKAECADFLRELPHPMKEPLLR